MQQQASPLDGGLGAMRQALTAARTRAYLSQPSEYFLRHFHSRRWSFEPFTLLPDAPRTGPRLYHVASFGKNVGDRLLPIAVRDLFTSSIGASWRARAAHDVVGAAATKQINSRDGIIVGGGGLFLVDTNPNQLSGWQWSCSIDRLRKIDRPLALFAVGYNRFRDQPEFSPLFSEHLAELATRAVYIGLRNSGSISAVRRYLPDELHDKVRFQPCPTTVLSHLYPAAFTGGASAGLVGINCAFDRSTNRYGNRRDEVLTSIAGAIRRSLDGRELVVICHTPTDEEIAPVLRRAGLKFQIARLDKSAPDMAMNFYERFDLVVGMRGHAQMIPFGCGTPIVSVVSHDKMRWFLDDLGKPEWGVDVNSPGFGEELAAAIDDALSDASRRSEIRALQDRLWRVTQANVADFASAVSTS